MYILDFCICKFPIRLNIYEKEVYPFRVNLLLHLLDKETGLLFPHFDFIVLQHILLSRFRYEYVVVTIYF